MRGEGGGEGGLESLEGNQDGQLLIEETASWGLEQRFPVLITSYIDYIPLQDFFFLQEMLTAVDANIEYCVESF